MERGNAKRICQYIEKNHSELLEKLDIKLEVASGLMERIEVKEPPAIFQPYMEGKGYCNRDRFFTYSACDVLAFFVMAQERLFDCDEYNHEVSLLLGERIKVSDLCGTTRLKKIDEAVRLQNAIREILEKDIPVILDFRGIYDATYEFLITALGFYYKEEDLTRLNHYLLFENLNQEKIYENIRIIKTNIYSFRHNPELARIANFLNN